MADSISASCEDAILKKVKHKILSPPEIKDLMYQYSEEFDGAKPKQVRDILIRKRNEDLRSAIADRDETGKTIKEILTDFGISYGMYWQIVKNNPANVMSSLRHCSEEGCEFPVYSHGLCTNHYQKDWRDRKGSYIQKFRRRKVFVDLIVRIQEGDSRISEALTHLYGIDAKTLRAIAKITEGLEWETAKPKLDQAAIEQIEHHLGIREINKFLKERNPKKGKVQGISEARQKKARREFLDFIRAQDPLEFAAVGEKYGIEVELLNNLAASEPEELDWGVVCFSLSKDQAIAIEEGFSRKEVYPLPQVPLLLPSTPPSKIQSLLQRMEAMNI